MAYYTWDSEFEAQLTTWLWVWQKKSQRQIFLNLASETKTTNCKARWHRGYMRQQWDNFWGGPKLLKLLFAQRDTNNTV